jgi:hypothetical protein
MKAETTDNDPKFNLLKPDGVRSQAHSEVISQVLLNDGIWYQIKEGSFKFFKTSGDKAVPFVQFKLNDEIVDADGTRRRHVIEVFPASVVGIAYTTVEAEEAAPLADPEQWPPATTA